MRRRVPFGPIRGLGADAMTVSPWLGSDALAPFIEIARERGAGVFLLVRNSNPGAVELQDRELDDGSVSDVVGTDGRRRGCRRGGESRAWRTSVRWSAPPHRVSSRACAGLMPHAVFLLPGVGAQGGRIEDLAAVFTQGVASGLIAVSRGIVQAHRLDGGDPADAARRTAARLRAQAWTLPQ